MVLTWEDLSTSGFDFRDLYHSKIDSVAGLIDFLSIIRVSRSSRNDQLHRILKVERGYVCEVCGSRNLKIDVHHIGSVWDDSKDNLMLCCPSCHK